MALSSKAKKDGKKGQKKNDKNQQQQQQQQVQNGTDSSSQQSASSQPEYPGGPPQPQPPMEHKDVKSPNGGAGAQMPPQQQHPPMPPHPGMMEGQHMPPMHGAEYGMPPQGMPPMGPEHHQHMPPQGPPPPQNKDDPNAQMPPGQHWPPMHQQYPPARYHHDPNQMPPDPYGHYRQMPGGKPGASMIPPNRPPQRYMPGQGPPPPPQQGNPPPPSQGAPPNAQGQAPQAPGQQQGPTPTLNSLLQSQGNPQQQPQPPHQRYPNSYDPNQQQPPPQGYGQQNWGPQPPRPYSPQMNPQQSYRPPPGTPPRGQSPYPPPPGQQPYPGPPGPNQQQSQQPGGPPPMPPTSQGPNPPSQYSYPQRYPTPPNPQQGIRGPYPPHQYPEPNRTWPSPAASPGPIGHPPQSPHGAPCPSPQPAQSPHQYPQRPSQSSTPVQSDGETNMGEQGGQNSNDSSSGGAGNSSAPNSQQGMRPTPSPTGSSGSRSMSPAVGQQNIQMPPRPSSSHSQVPNQVATNSNSSSSNLGNQQQQQQQQTQPPLDTSLGSPGRPPSASSQNQQQQQQQQQVPPQSAPGSIPPPNMAAAQGSYQQQPPPPPHMHGGYKGGPQGMSPYPASQQYSPQPNYSPRGPYPGQYGQPPPPNSMAPGQYPGHRMPNHVAPHQQYAPYNQNWGPPPPQGMMQNHVPGKGAPPNSPQGSPRPINYLKQHLQVKGGYQQPGQGPPPAQGYGNGPGMHPPMGPPHHMAPPMTNMGPPQSTTGSMPPQNMPPNSHPDASPMPPHMDPAQQQQIQSQDNGIPPPPSQLPHPVTSIVTTGPDGAPLDEASQQSTISNASAASADDPSQCSTPKSSRKSSLDPQYNQNHLPPPQPNASPSSHPPPGSGEDYEMGASPQQWQGRTPASPGFNTHAAPLETYKSPKPNTKKSDSIAKLYEMDDNPERKIWLDKLMSYMEDRRTPITACPTISKQALDLYRLYLYVKERGGFVEVCKVSKSKTWKDVAGLLGIGASSSAAYTLRKHYTKSILPFECQFDRGGIDPGPIAQSIEAGSKKKAAAKAASIPSPGSSNSQDSFPPPGSSGGSMDGYGTPYPGQTAPAGYPPGGPPGPDYNQPPMQRPPSQTTPQSAHPGPGPTPTSGDNISASNPFDDPVGPQRTPYQPHQQGSHPSYPPHSRPQGASYPQPPQQGSYNQYPEQGYPPTGPAGQYPPQQGQFPPQNRQMYPPYGPPPPSTGPEGENSHTSQTPPTTGAPTPANDPYRGYPQTGPQGPYPPNSGPRPYPQQQTQPPPPQQSQQQTQPPSAPSTVPPTGPSQAPTNAPQGPAQGPPPGAYPPGPPSQDYYRPPEQSAPRRHPDFEKQPYPGYGGPQRPQMYGGWQNNQGQYRGPPGSYGPQSGPPGWNSNVQRPPQGPPGMPQGPGPNAPPQWADQSRYPPNQQPPYPHQQNPPQWGPQAGNVQSSPLRAPPRGGKPFPMPPPQGAKPMQPFPGPPGMQQKRDIAFPPDSVEATTPVLYRRKRICRMDIGATDPWRLFMALRSGLLSETTWALDVLNILLFDDSTVAYFGLAHLPGLLNLLLDHFQKSLIDVFDKNGRKTDYVAIESVKDLDKEEERKKLAAELGAVTELPRPEDRVQVLTSSTNYTMSSRKGLPVKISEVSEEDIFILDTLKSWDKASDSKYQSASAIGCDAWTAGHTEPDPYDYIMDTFHAEFVNIPFAKYLKSNKKPKVENADDPEPVKPTPERKTSKAKAFLASSEPENPNDIVKNTISKMNKENNRFNNVNIGTDRKENGPAAPIKRESSDADCREIDMELEKIPNGPSPTNVGKERDEKTADLVPKEEKMETDELFAKEPSEKGFDLLETARDPSRILKRRRISDYEDECYTRDEASLYLITESQDTLARRCVGISNILRNLTFVPGNEIEFARSETFLSILGKLLLLHHDHLVRAKKTRNYDREEDADFTDSCSSLQGENEWWWDYLIQIRENMLVAAANIAGHMELSSFDEVISRPVLDGLLHWAVCPAAHGQDPFPTCGPHSSLSPQRLALEALCKLCVTDANVDLVIATPPFSRLEKLCAVLTRHLCKNEDQVLREFSVNLLHYLAAADSTMARTVAMQSPCVSYLVAFIEQAEQTALGVANQHGINFLRENPDSMGTSLDMLRRAAGTLLHLARHPDNRPLFMQQEQRLLGLVMSHILDQQVALIISRVLFQCSRGPGPLTTAELIASQKPPTKMSTETSTTASAILGTTNIPGVTDAKSPSANCVEGGASVPISQLVSSANTTTLMGAATATETSPLSASDMKSPEPAGALTNMTTPAESKILETAEKTTELTSAATTTPATTTTTESEKPETKATDKKQPENNDETTNPSNKDVSSTPVNNPSEKASIDTAAAANAQPANSVTTGVTPQLQQTVAAGSS
ncbi:trithorax group protein osa isoform X3 [Culicoides brevitarsis]|uniref:trithorax group protein osa isoform X3 n=1 Tax=Culicoides brevitarsis TaxID=469753 RepID=UPI00307B44B9